MVECVTSFNLFNLKGVFATRLYGKKMCVMTKIDKTVFPSMEVLRTVSNLKAVRSSIFYSYNVINRDIGLKDFLSMSIHLTRTA